jgi:VWFA-related protein
MTRCRSGPAAGIVVLLVVTTAGAWLAAAGASRQQSDAQAPTFRGGVDVVQLDVTVLDGNRRPIRGLTAADFTVTEDGAARPIVAFSPVELPPRVEPTAAWMRDAVPDVVSNDHRTGRVIVIMFDDAHTGHQGAYWDPWVLGAGRHIARDIVNSLGPEDRAAVTFAFMGHDQNFTPDRARLLAAIDSFTPKDSPSAGPPLGCAYRGRSGCVLDSMEHIVDALPSLPPRRKVLVLISAGKFPIPALDFDQDAPTLRDPQTPQLEDAVALFRKLQQANVTVYAFSPHGLEIRGVSSGDEKLKLFAEQTGGRAVVQSNAPWEGVPAMFAETSAYYLVAFQSAHRDGRLHRITVQVNRPGAAVRTRSGYVAQAPEGKPKRGRPVVPPTPLEAAMAGGFPDRTVALAVAAAPFAVPGQRELSVLVTTAVDPPDGDEAPRVATIRATAFDNNWKDRATAWTTIEWPAPAATAGVVTSTLALKPGRYELRVAAETRGRAGSVFLDLDVPNVTRERLSLSGLVVGGPARGEADTPATPLDLPVRPALSRTFRPVDRIAAFLRVYQGGRSTPKPVSVRTTIVDEAGVMVVDRTTDVGPERFGPDRAADVLYDLPLDSLRTGEYLLTIEATLGDICLPRTVRFRVA